MDFFLGLYGVGKSKYEDLRQETCSPFMRYFVKLSHETLHIEK